MVGLSHQSHHLSLNAKLTGRRRRREALRPLPQKEVAFVRVLQWHASGVGCHCWQSNAVSYRGYHTIATVLLCLRENGSLHANAICFIVGFVLQWPSPGRLEVGLPTPSAAMRFHPPLPPTKLTSSLRAVWIDAIDLTASRHRSCLRVMPFGKPKTHHSTRSIVGFALQWPSRG